MRIKGENTANTENVCVNNKLGVLSLLVFIKLKRPYNGYSFTHSSMKQVFLKHLLYSRHCS